MLAVVYARNCSFDSPMVMVGIVPSRYSYGLIKETGVFVANLVPASMKAAWDYLGSHEMFIGLVEYVHADAGLVGPEGKIDWSAIDFLRI